MADREYLARLQRQLADDGRLIEAGWVAMRLLTLPADTGPAQLHDMRMAFMAGAQHLFGSIMTILDPGTEETPADMRRMDLIDAELAAFTDEPRAELIRKGIKVPPTTGRT
jgi:hypothetical protein